MPLSCIVSVVDLAGRREAVRMAFHAGIDESFDIPPHPSGTTWFSGPHGKADQVRAIWVALGRGDSARLKSATPRTGPRPLGPNAIGSA
jgi:hypothetical protein